MEEHEEGFDPTRQLGHDDLEAGKTAWRTWNKTTSYADIKRDRSRTRAAFFAGYRYALYDVDHGRFDSEEG